MLCYAGHAVLFPCNAPLNFADAVCPEFRVETDAVPVHHDLAEVPIRIQELVADPEQVLGALLIEKHARAHPRVHEEVVALGVGCCEPLEEA